MPSRPAAPTAASKSGPARSLPLPAGRLAGVAVLGVTAGWLGRTLFRAVRGLPDALGASRSTIRDRVASAPQFDGQQFKNVLPVTTMAPGSGGAMLKAFAAKGGSGKPVADIPLWSVSDADRVPADLAVTWFGHASVLIEIDGYTVLADPVWGERVSPSPTVGPKRLHPVPIALAELPEVDVVIISHDHYDHLDLPTIRYLAENRPTPFVVPRGVGEHLRIWGVDESRIVELDWDGSHSIGELTLTCTEAQHFSGRGLTRDDTLWSSWVITTDRHRVFFGGDTGYTPAFAELGRAYGPFDLSLLPIGAYGDQWAAIHLNPEEAVATHADIRGGLFVPIHWASFDLAFHRWSEPIERLLVAAAENGVALATPMPGQRVVVAEPPAMTAWWTGPAGD